jgi:hypothetical protein
MVDTRRIEISYVSEEKKSKEIPEVVTSEMGTAQTPSVPSAERCGRGVARRS